MIKPIGPGTTTDEITARVLQMFDQQLDVLVDPVRWSR